MPSYSQSDGCSGATSLPVTATCSSPTSGTTIGATQTISGCVGTADDDVWYTFTATATSHVITVVPSASMDPVVQLFSGPCASLISLNCMDNGMTGETETISASGLTIGVVYTIRVYHYYAGSGSGTFTICVTQAPTAPANDNCSNATLLTVNASCSYTNATSVSATQSQAGCAGTADDDVWFKFVATNSVQTITVDPSVSMDPVVELFSGSCAALTQVTCMDVGFTDGNEVISAVGLIPGTTYYVRVYDYYSGTGGAPFQICITGTPTSAPTNDEACSAIQLPAVTSACNFLSFTTVGATTSTTSPTPASCSGGSTPQQGGFNNTPQPKDVWFKITVPSSGVISITAQPGYGISDGVMSLYSGTCSSLTQIACSDDYNYPGGTNDYKPFILATGLTPGATVYLRYWAFNGNTTNVFGLCVSTPTNDNCANNLYICDLNNYSGTTSAAYSADRPCNMRGNAETNNPPTYTYTPGTCQGGIFGLGGAWGTGAPNCDVQINNNSWLQFTASNTVATLTVNITNCFIGSYPSGGIQMQIFSAGSACCSYTPVSDFKEGSSQLTITANNLIIGNNYYLMIDGFAGDICSYSISATAGVQFPGITTANSTICAGQTITLNGPAGASAYDWLPGGQTTQNITVTPAYSQTYSLEVTGVCGYRQTLTIPITVKNLPTTANAGTDQTLCGSTYTLAGNTATSGTGTWTLVSGSGIITTPSSPTSGITGLAVGTNVFQWTIANAPCTSSSDQVSITITSTPTVAAAGTDKSVCGTSTTLAGNIPSTGTGTWTLVSGSGTITSPSSPTSGITGLGVGANVFQWTITSAPCTPSSDQVTITGVASPTTANAGTDQTLCGSTYTLAGNTATNGTGTWTLISGSGTITNPSSPTSGVTGLAVGTNVFQWTIVNAPCTSSSDQVSITITSTPTVAAAGTDNSICGTTTTLAGNTPSTGTGSWTLISGSGTITSPSSPTSGITSLGVGANVFQWTITSAPCTPSSDQVTITGVASPTTANAGNDQTLCGNTATLIGNTATIGAGTWTLVSGSGTVTNPSSPTSGITSLGTGNNVFQWTIANAPCTSSSDQMTITITPLPTSAAAGTDQSVCGTTATLAGNTPTTGTGSWTLISGSGTITSPSSPTSGITSLGVGANIFEWTISNSPCAPSSDQVKITGVASPTTANAGSDQTLCGSTYTLSGNTPTTGTGTWILVSGSGTITNPSSPTSGITGLAVGVNVFQWTIDNVPCTSSSDQVSITITSTPTVASAGTNQTICGTTATLAGNSPATGTGTWTLISGAGTITAPSSPTSGVTGLGVGPNVFEWTISSPPCTPSSSQVTITGVASPTAANAGTDQTLCGSTFTLAGNTPTTGTGTWTLVSGSGTITNPSSTTSGITGLAVGVNIFQWTIANAPCTSTSDQVSITITSTPTLASAGTSQTICGTTATLAGNAPATGTGMWILISGSGTITAPSSPTSGVTSLGVGPNVFEWTISSPPCTPSSSQVTITGVASPTTADAGFDQTICGNTATLAGNAPSIGAGTWTLVSGSGTITNSTSPLSGIAGLGIGINVFQWTIANSPCSSSSDLVSITTTSTPTVAAAGTNQTICGTSATLAGNSPVTGTGLWTLISGSGTITAPSSATSGVTGLGVGQNVFEWTISNSPCTPSSSQVIITGVALPTFADAGPDQSLCSNIATLSGNNAAFGTGTWILISGTGTITAPSSPNSGVSGLIAGVNIFQWTIANAPCTASSDQVSISVSSIPTTAVAGTDQSVCGTTETLAGNVASNGAGIWILVSGSGTITSPSSATSGVTSLGIGPNVFEWTISNPPCTPSTDQVIITGVASPTIANAGLDQTLLYGTSTTTLAGNAAIIGTGTWTLISGAGTVNTPSSPTSGITGLGSGLNIFQWTIENAPCPSSSDTVIINKPDFQIEIPTAITPNGDGINDDF